MAHRDAREGKWRGKIWMEWVASSLALYVRTRSIQSLSADPHFSTASSRLNWHPRRFKWTRPFRRKTKSGFCACAITFRMCYTNRHFERSYCHNLQSQTVWGDTSVTIYQFTPSKIPLDLIFFNNTAIRTVNFAVLLLQPQRFMLLHLLWTTALNAEPGDSVSVAS